jgi:putative transposase
LESRYKVVFLDVLFITLRRGSEYAKEVLYIASGVREDNRRELLILSINPTESTLEWKLLLQDLKEKRGVEEISLFVADGLIGLESEAIKVFPKAKFQKCIVHKMRNILNKVKPKDKKEVGEDIKEAFNNFKEEDTLEMLCTKENSFF